MYLKIVTQPNGSCRLASSRTRPDNASCFLTGENSSQCVQVGVYLHYGDQVPTGELKLYGTIVTVDGDNHPYRLQGPGCKDGLFVHTFRWDSTAMEKIISLDGVMAVTCPSTKWAEAMEAKMRNLSILSDSPSAAPKLAPQSVKKFRLSFHMEGASRIVTDIIQGSGQSPGAASGSAGGPSLTVEVVDILPSELHVYSGSPSLEVALLLSDSAPDGGVTRMSGTFACSASKQPIEFDCSELDRIKHLVRAKMNVTPLIEMLGQRADKDWTCQLRVAMETNGGQAQTAETGPIRLHYGCQACSGANSQHVEGTPGGYEADYQYQYHYQYQPQVAEPPLRRKLPGGGACGVGGGGFGELPTGAADTAAQPVDLVQVALLEASNRPPAVKQQEEAAALVTDGSYAAAAVAAAAAADRHERQQRSSFNADELLQASSSSNSWLDDIMEVIESDSALGGTSA